MTRNELIKEVLKEEPKKYKNKKEAHDHYRNTRSKVQIILDSMAIALANGKRIELRGFGIFTTRKRKSRLGRNPRTGESVKVETKFIPFYKAGTEIKREVNN